VCYGLSAIDSSVHNPPYLPYLPAFPFPSLPPPSYLLPSPYLLLPTPTPLPPYLPTSYIPDLKPDNVGFASDGTLKLFDFGLVTCVKTRQMSSQFYQMTGFTGSLRYMAPEVALREPYTEKVDVYSYGVLLWQMARDRVPFCGLGKTDFMQEVVRGGIRPKVDKAWPLGFTNLLTSCWTRDPENRPSFSMICVDLNKLIKEEEEKGGRRYT
jgi:hypothetical protein